MPPTVLWKVELGGEIEPYETARDLDVDGDGTTETVCTGPDRVVCYERTKTVRWEVKGLPEVRWIDRADLHGSGRLGLFFESSNQRERSIHFIDGKTGSQHLLFSWHSAFGYRMGVGPVIPDDRTGGGQEQFYAIWDGWNPAGRGQIMHFYLFSSDPGTGEPRLVYHLSEEGNIFGAQFLVADADGDDKEDLLIVSMEQAWVYGLRDGRRKAHYQWQPGIRTYSAFIAAKRFNDSLVLTMINPHIPGLQAIALDKDGGARRLWKQVIGAKEDQYQQTLKIAPACPDPMVDLDGDGQVEILTRITNEHGDQKTHLVVFDSRSGKRLSESEDKVLTIDNLDGTGRPEVLLQRGGQLHMTRWQGGEFDTMWQAKGAEPVLRPALRPDFSCTSPGSRPGRNPSVAREGQHFVVKFGDHAWAYALTDRGVERVEQIAEIPAVPSRELAYRVSKRRKTYMPPPAIVGRFGTRLEVILRDHPGTLLGLDGNGNRQRVWTTESPSHPHNYENHFSQAEICDVDGDGANDLITTTVAGSPKPGRIVIFQADGRERLTIPPVAGANEVCLGATGRMGPKAQRWITAAYRFPNGNPLEVAYDGRSGAELWRREAYGPRGELVRFGYPCATLDYDGNGNDDMVVSAGNYYGLLDVAKNRDLLSPVTLGPNHLPGHWSTRFRTILVPMKERQPDVFLHRNNGVSAMLSLDGNYRWHYSLLPRENMPFNQEGVVDLDGDENYELITAHRDGTLRAFTNAAAAAKCPTCQTNAPLTNHNHAGQVRWTFTIPGPINPSVYRSDQDFASADLDGDGRMEVLLGSGDGHLYALKEVGDDCQVLWRVRLSERRIGSPILADLNDDGIAEILVPSEEGIVFCLARR